MGVQLGFTKFEEGRWDRICCQREWKSPYLLLGLRRREGTGPRGCLGGSGQAVSTGPSQALSFVQFCSKCGSQHPGASGNSEPRLSCEQTSSRQAGGLGAGLSSDTSVLGLRSKDTEGAGWRGRARVEGNELPAFCEGSE